MKLEKKHWVMLIAGVVILFLVYWFFFRKKKSESGYDSNILVIGNDSSYDPAFPEIGGESGYVAGGKCYTEVCPCNISNNKCTCDTQLVAVPCGNVKDSPWKGTSYRVVNRSTRVIKAPLTASESGFKARRASSSVMPVTPGPLQQLACHHSCDKVTACTQYNSAGNCIQWGSMCKCNGKLMPMEQMGFGNQ